MPYRLSAAASAEIEGIYERGLLMFGQHQADDYHDGLARTFEYLSEHPRAVRERDELRPPLRLYRYKAHLVAFRLEEDGTVFVVRVVHGHMDWQNELQSS